MPRAFFAALLLAAAAFAAQTVDGHVVDASTGADLPGVTIILGQPGMHSEHPPYRATTDAGGRFQIADVEDGVYRATYRAAGFWTPHEPSDIAQPSYAVSSSGEPLHIEARLQPIPRLSGRVSDPDGRPVPNVTIRMMQQGRACYLPSCFNFTHELTANENGEFSTADFEQPGTWIFAVVPPASLEPPRSQGQTLTWAESFYPGVTQAPLVAGLAVRSTIALPFLELKLAAAPARRVRGRVTDAEGHPAAKLALTLYNGFGHSLQQLSDDKGEFDFRNATAGEWRLTATRDRDGAKQWAAEAIVIGDRDPEAVTLRLSAPFVLHGRYFVEHPEGAPAYEGDPPDVIAARDLDSFGMDRTMPSVPLGHPNPELAFEIELYPGQYRFELLDQPQAPYYIDAVRLGNASALREEGVAIRSAEEPVSIVLKYGGGAVRGAVEGCNGGRAVLFPSDPALLHAGFIREAKCGANGQFEIANIRPGHYFGLAVNSDTSMDWWPVLTDEAVKQQAVSITVQDGETTRADIRLIRF